MLTLFLTAAALSPHQDLEPAHLQPSEWLRIAAVDSRGRRPFRPDAVFERYLLEPGPVPEVGESITGSEGENSWEALTAEGRVGMRGRGAYAYTAVEVEEAGVYLAELRGATDLFVNGEGVAGDVYRYGFEGYPIALKAGRNDLFVTGARGGFDLKLLPVEPGLRFAARDRMVPDLVRGEAQAGYLGLLLVNARTAALGPPRFEVEAPPYLSLSPPIRFGPHSISPLGLVRVQFWVEVQEIPADVGQVTAIVRELNTGAETTVTFTVRDPGERHRRTYLSDVDGSVQEYVINPPRGETDGPMRLALSLHGAGVGAWGQAASYSPKPDFWVVAPTNRRKFGFDWQDWGRRDAYDVLEDALRVSGVDRRYVYVTGHSMGGHGTWHLAANDPDTFAACGPSAGWATFDTYGGRPEQDERWLRADAASLTLDLVENLKQVPPYIIHGTADNNVPPGQALTMLEALTKVGATVELHLQGGAGHWWGGRCVDWPPLFDHFRAHELPQYPDRIEFVTVDPSVDAQHHWIRVEQPLEYGSSSRVKAVDEQDQITVETTNVRVLTIDRPARSLLLDGDTLGPTKGPSSFTRAGGVWKLKGPDAGEKRPDRGGPFKAAFDRHFVLVVGTGGDDARDAALLGRARHDAGVWSYRGNGNAPIMTDEAFLARSSNDVVPNVILYGNRGDNAAWGHLLGERPSLDVLEGQVRLGARRFEGDFAAVFVLPSVVPTGGLVGAFASTSTKAARLGSTFAPFISGVGYPDYAVIGLDVLRRGDDGVVAAGWFDHAWKLPE